jgi:hypothetical protein
MAERKDKPGFSAADILQILDRQFHCTQTAGP